MKITKLFTLSLIGSFLLHSCSSDDNNDIVEPTPPESAAYTNGVFVVNEGSQSTGTVSFLDAASTSIENNIFETVNPEMDLGKFVQSMFFDEDNAYIIANGSNLITVVDRYTFEYKGQVDSGLNIPYYGVVYDGKAYVTNLADFSTGTGDFIAVIDLTSLEVEETVVAGTYLDFVDEEDGVIYVEGASFGTGNAVHAFDPATNSITKTYTTVEGVNSFEIEGEQLFALSSSQLQVFNLDSGEETYHIDFPEEVNSARNLVFENDMFYFTSGLAVYGLAETATTFPEESLFEFTDVITLYAFDVEDGFIWTGDAKDYASAGTVRIYNNSGELENEFEVGVNPNSFYFID